MALFQWLSQWGVTLFSGATEHFAPEQGNHSSVWPTSLDKLCAGIVSKTPLPSLAQPITGVVYDSRQVAAGNLFVALRGKHTDGHHYVNNAFERGALVAFVEQTVGASEHQIIVEDTLAVLAQLACNAYNHPSRQISMVGVTGSNGKTTSTYILEKILEAARWTPGLIGTIENRWAGTTYTPVHTTPFALELQEALYNMAQHGATHAVMEVSSHALALHRVDGIKFDAALFTNLSPEHLDFHHTMEAYGACKRRLFEEHLADDGWSVINRDDEFGQQLLACLSPRQTVDYGFNKYARVHPHRYELQPQGISAEISSPYGKFEIESSLVGRHNLSNLMGAIATAQTLGVRIPAIIEGIRRLNEVPGRLERVNLGQQFQVFVDYAHTPDGLRQVLSTLCELPHQRVICVFGAGGDRDKFKRPIMGKIAQELAQTIVITSDNPRTEDPEAIIEDIKSGLVADSPCQVEVIPNRAEAITYAVGICEPGDILAVCGKGHEDYQIIGTEKIHFDDREYVAQAIRQHCLREEQS